MMRARVILRPLVAVLAFAAVLVLLLRSSTLAQNGDRGVLADLISKALSSSTSQVSIGAVDGALSSDATIRDITVSDKDGVWLRLDRARLIWTRSALLLRRLEVDRLEIGKLEILRKPSPIAPGTTEPKNDEPILPELPVKVQIKAFQLAELALGEPILGVAARLSASGNLSLGPPSEGLDLTFGAKRLDAPGTFAVKVGFIPSNNSLTTSVQVDEPAGGVIARLATLPGLPPVKLDIGGKGTLDDFIAKLTFNAGPSVGAEGSAQLGRTASGRQLSLNLTSRIEGLMPAVVAPVFAGTTQLTGIMGFADDGGFDIRTLALAAPLARLDIAGRYTADQKLDFKVTAAAVPTEAGKTKAGASEIGKLNFEGTIAGPLQGPLVRATLAMQDALVPAGRFGKLDASFTAAPTGLYGDPDTRLKLEADGSASGLVLADKRLDSAIGDRVGFSLRGSAAPDGIVDFQTMRLSAAGAEISYSGLAGASKLFGALQASFPDLSRFSGLAGRKLAGEVKLSAKIDGKPKANDIAAILDGQATKLSTALPAFDQLSGGNLSLQGGLRTLPDGRYRLDALTINGAHVTARAAGNASAENADLTLSIDLPELSRADDRLSGHGQANAHLYGPSSKLDADAQVGISGAKALGRPIPQLDLNATLRDLQGALETRLTLSGSVDGKPASGLITARRPVDGGWQVSSATVNVGSVALTGNAVIAANSLVTGQVALAARDLNDLSPLILTKLAGQLDACITLNAPEGKQGVQAKANGSRIAIAGTTIDKLALALDVADALQQPVINANASIDRAMFGGEAISSIKLDAKGTQTASDIGLIANARGFDLNGKGRLMPGSPLRFDLQSFEARRDGRKIALANPASFAVSGSDVTIGNLAVLVDGGRITMDGKAGAALDLHLAARAVPLSAARIASPSLDLSGALDAEAHITGSSSAPSGPWQVKIANLVTPQSRSAGLQPINVTATGSLSGDRTRLDATISAGKITSLTVTGSAPLRVSGSLDVTARGTIDAALANASLAAGGRRLTGSIAVDMRATGGITAPKIGGSATLFNGSFNDALQGVQINGLQGRVVANGTDLTIERLSGTTRNGGTITASGKVKADPGAGFPADIRVQSQNAELVSNGVVAAVADLALRLSGPLAQRPQISGTVAIDSMDVRVPDRLPASLRPIEGIKHIHPTKTVAARLAAERKAQQGGRKGGRAPIFDAVIDVSISAPSKVFVRGRGIDAELGGELKISGTSSSPVTIGAFDLRRGRLQVLGQRLDFTRGRLTFSGDVLPDLDFLAETRAADVTAQIAVTGSAGQPSFAFSSQPQLPQDEVLSRILFAKASGQLSAFQAIQLAQAAAQFAGGGGDDTFETLRKSLGVDNLDVQLGATGGPTVGVSRYIGNNISVGVKTGVKPEESGVSVGIDVTKHLRLQAEGQANGAAAAGVAAEWEY